MEVMFFCCKMSEVDTKKSKILNLNNPPFLKKTIVEKKVIEITTLAYFTSSLHPI